MRPATLLFYGFATFCLGIMAVAAGAGRILAALIGRPEATEGAQLAFLAVTVALAALYVMLAAFYVVTRDPEPDDA